MTRQPTDRRRKPQSYPYIDETKAFPDGTLWVRVVTEDGVFSGVLSLNVKGNGGAE